tara:strand:- start:106 stop:300 length:195 start_codon:yes stop_codon:yes gene_type:complete
MPDEGVLLMSMEDKTDSTLNVAGYTTLGVTMGFLRVIVPIAMMGLAFGMSMRVMKTGVRIGRIE